MKIIVAISGASGVSLGLKLLKQIPSSHEISLISTESAKVVLEKEETTLYDDTNISAPPASGSFGAEAMIIAPCSMNTLAKVACGLADNLTTRTASVMIKEQKKLVLCPREMPLSAIALENMLKLARLGVGIAPPVLGYYSKQQTLEEMENFIIGKWLDLLGIQNNLYQRWEG